MTQTETIQIIDNVLSEESLKELQALAVGYGSVPYNYSDAAVPQYEQDKHSHLAHISEDLPYGHHHFVHKIFESSLRLESSILPVLEPILDYLAPVAIFRVKMNMNMPTKEHRLGGWHTDFDSKSTNGAFTAVFYVTSNNGYTLLEDGTKIDSVENRLVVFPSNVIHSGVSQTDDSPRCVININYFI